MTVNKFEDTTNCELNWLINSTGKKKLENKAKSTTPTAVIKASESINFIPATTETEKVDAKVNIGKSINSVKIPRPNTAHKTSSEFMKRKTTV